MIPVVRLGPGAQWDQCLLDDLLSGALWPHGIEFERVDDFPDADGVVLVIPGRYFADRAAEISEKIARYRWVLAFRVGDEEDLLDIRRIAHPNIRWLIQTPRVGRDYGDARFIGVGYPPHLRRLHPEPPAKNLDVFLAGQDTHERRHQAFAALQPGERRRIEPTPGFTQGMDPTEYVRCMTAAKVAPAPSGAVSPDSFRVYEALEAHSVPIADDVSPTYDSRGYWERLFPGAPFPILRNYSDLPGWITDQLADWPRSGNRVAAWWLAEKRRMAEHLRADLIALGADAGDCRPPITAIITTSPVRSHPSTEILEETVVSVRERLPDAEIVIAFDGVRAEQADRAADYDEYIRRVLWKADHEWGNTLPLLSDEHLHQAVCVKRALKHVRTPLVLMLEHDTPLCGDIPFGDLAEVVLAGAANVIRLHHEASVLEPHRYLMLDDEPQKVRGVPMMRTIQWSNRPHLASVAWYRELLDRWFPNDERNFVEDVVYGRLIAAHERDGEMGWLGWRTWLYTPEGDIKRSFHTDGRAGESKFG